jgi:DNA polymerase-3 subunit delta'
VSPQPSTAAPQDDPWRAVPGQDRLRGGGAQLRAAAPEPVHAYLFIGPPGSGKQVAARVFAGEVLAATAATSEAVARHRGLAAADQHPDVTVVRREGASIQVRQAAEIVRLASMKPVEGARKVLILDEFHLVADATAGKLLKTVEEPPGGTVFVVLADDLPGELVTIASRCVPVEFPSLTAEVVAAELVGEGLDPRRAEQVARVAHGDVDRARLLAGDERFAVRVEAWRAVGGRLDGTGAMAADIVAELRAAIDDAAATLQDRHAVEIAELDERIERYGQRGAGGRQLEESHRRQLRRLRTDEVRMGLGELAHTYRDHMVAAAAVPALAAGPDEAARIDGAARALAALNGALDALVRNPNEELLLQALLLRLPPGH